MKFTDLFIQRPVLASVVSLLILVVGLRSFTVLDLREFPEISNTVVSVTTGCRISGLTGHHRLSGRQQ